MAQQAAQLQQAGQQHQLLLQQKAHAEQGVAELQRQLTTATQDIEQAGQTLAAAIAGADAARQLEEDQQQEGAYSPPKPSTTDTPMGS